MIWAVAYQSLGDLSKTVFGGLPSTFVFYAGKSLQGSSPSVYSITLTWRHWSNIFRLRSYVVGLAKQCSSYKIDLGIRSWVGLLSLAWVLCSNGFQQVFSSAVVTLASFDLTKYRNACIQAVAYWLNIFYQPSFCRCWFTDISFWFELKISFSH